MASGWTGSRVGDVTLRARYGGAGQPVVLLHGHPRTHMTWHRVAPQLAGSFFLALAATCAATASPRCPRMRQDTPSRASERWPATSNWP